MTSRLPRPHARAHVHLAVGLDGVGHHPAAWRAAHTTPERIFSAAYWTELVREAERGTLDFVRIDDGFAPQSEHLDQLNGRLDAVTLLARVAPDTSHIGLVPVATSTHTEPFHVSTALATLDYVSHGRAGWWAKPSVSEAEALVFGRRPVAPHGELLDEAYEFIDVVGRLWDSWEDDAVIRDTATGRFIDRERVHHVNFTSPYFDVRGPSITPRPPQGRPVVAFFVDGDPTLEIAALAADVLFVDAATPEQARRLRTRALHIAETAGRDPDTLRVLADVTVVLGSDKAEASRARRALSALRTPSARTAERDRTGALQFTGTGTGLADLIEAWTASGAVDGFTVLPALLPDGLTTFVDQVVPVLRDRGLFRDAYTADTLRGHLGLTRPPSRYARSLARTTP